jgi:pSer/pThr/pTyr-binding forkhead associated (FHA) protein
MTRVALPAQDRQSSHERHAAINQFSEPAQSAMPERSASVSGAASANFDSQASSLKSAHARLVIERGRSAGKGFAISETEVHIGRWDADGGIFPDVDLDSDDPEAKVSRRHARILRRADGYYIEDLGSTNGTFVNRGRRLLPGALQPLRDGDEIIVGKTFLRLNIIK